MDNSVAQELEYTLKPRGRSDFRPIRMKVSWWATRLGMTDDAFRIAYINKHRVPVATPGEKGGYIYFEHMIPILVAEFKDSDATSLAEWLNEQLADDELLAAVS